MNRKIFLALTVFSIQVLLPMQKTSGPTFFEVEADVKNMLSICEDRCTFMKDVTQNCTSNCFMDYGKQREYFLVRRYTAECSNRPFNEEWRFKTDIKDKVVDLGGTNQAYMQWGSPESALAQCAQERIGLHVEKMTQLGKRKQRELDRFDKEHPVISGAVSVSNKLRGIGKIDQ